MTPLPKITKHQEHVVMYLYSFRFLTRTHIQALLLNKDKSRINKWLADLRAKHHIQGIYRRAPGDINKPAVYFSSLGAIRYLKTRPTTQSSIITRLYRDNSRSQDFIDLCLLVADIAIQLLQATGPNTRFDFATASDLADPQSSVHFLTNTPVSPDLVIVRTTYHASSYHLIQLLPSTLRASKTRSIIRNYINLYRSEEWEDKTGTNFPQVLFVCGTLFQLVQAKKYAYSLLDPSDSLTLDFMFQDDLKSTSITERLRN